MFLSATVDLNSIDVVGAMHVRHEDDPFCVRRESQIRLKPVVVVGQIHEPLGAQIFDEDLVVLVAGRIFIDDRFGAQQDEPFTVCLLYTSDAADE